MNSKLITAIWNSFLFSAQTRMSGINYQTQQIRKGAADAIKKPMATLEEEHPADTQKKIVDMVASRVRHLW